MTTFDRPVLFAAVYASLWVLAAVCCPVGWIGYNG